MNKTANFKYTFPIAKAEARADGNYIIGYASGPEIDSEGERISVEAIKMFSDQINASSDGERLPYVDAHAPDGVMRELGEITRAWITEKLHLGIEVKLDMDNAASDTLWKRINKGKQYGMSVAGRVLDYAMEFAESVGKSVLTYKNVVLDEISNTTRPAWYPSLGTVLAKSIKDASSNDAAGETVDNDTLLDETVEDATKSDVTEGDVDETQKTEAASESTDETTAKADESTDSGDESTEKSADGDDADVVKSGRKVSGATATRLIGLFTEMQTTLTELGVLDAPEATESAGITDSEKSASSTEEDTIEKTGEVEATADTISKSEFDELAAALTKATERIAELEARPATELPGVITDATKRAAVEELADVFAKASPSDKIRLAFAARTGGK